MKKYMGLMLSTLAGCVLATSAHAEISLSNQTFSNGFQSGTVSADGGSSSNVQAGEFRFDVDGSDKTLDAFCVDVTRTLNIPATYSVDSPADADFQRVKDNLQSVTALYNLHYDSVTDSNSSAAFQVALWALIYDNFSFNNFGATVNALASDWIDSVGDWDGSNRFDFHVLSPKSPTKNQALLTVKPSAVPAPGALGLLGAGLLVLGVASRRRKS